MLLDKFTTQVWIGLADVKYIVGCCLPIAMFSLIPHWDQFASTNTLVLYLNRHTTYAPSNIDDQ